MTESSAAPSPVVVVTGANGLVGSRTCAALVDRGATVRAVVRRSGTAPALAGVEEWVGEFHDPDFAAAVVAGASAVVTTVHPMGTDFETQHRVAVEVRRSSRGRPATRVSNAWCTSPPRRSMTARPGSVTSMRPPRWSPTMPTPTPSPSGTPTPPWPRSTVSPASCSARRRSSAPGESSIWNTLRPAAIRDEEQARRAVPDQSFAWVHVDDLASLAADVASGRVETSTDPERGPVAGACTVVNVAAGPATARDYYETVTGALGLEPVWDDGPAWTGRILAGRAHGWGWVPTVDLTRALAEIDRGLRA